jgi:hypothetical protein
MCTGPVPGIPRTVRAAKAVQNIALEAMANAARQFRRPGRGRKGRDSLDR